MINILNKRTSTQGNLPTVSNLEFGELAINTYDGKLFLKRDTGTPEIIEVGKTHEWVVKTSNYTSKYSDKIMADTSSSAFTVTLPSSPVIGEEITIIDFDGTWSTNNLTIDGNGKNIYGSTSDLLCDVDGAKINVIYTNPTDGWRVYIETSNESDNGSEWIIKTANYLAEINNKIMADTSSSSFIITLPLAPLNGFEVTIVDHSGTWFTNNLIVNGNGENIDSGSSNGVYSISSSKVVFIYTNSTIGWKTYIDADIIDAGYF